MLLPDCRMPSRPLPHCLTDRFVEHMRKYVAIFALAAAAMSCSSGSGVDNPSLDPSREMTQVEIETLSGGELGTVFNSTYLAYEQETPAVTNSGMSEAFIHGEYFFDNAFKQESKPFNGLGPLYIRSSCKDCHPGYGHGARMEQYRAGEKGNGYLLVVYDKTTSAYLMSLAGMPQTKAVAPFKAPIDEDGISIAWKEYTDEWGNKFADGETYSLIYPEVTIAEDAYYVPLIAKRGGENVEIPYEDVEVRLENTIGIYGSGLLDAIDEEDLKAEFARQEAYFKENFPGEVKINPGMFKDGEWVEAYLYANKQDPSHPLPKKFTYAMTRATIQDGPGANAIWNITNVTRSDRRYHYLDLAGVYYAQVASKDEDVQAKFYEKFPEWNKTGNVEQDIYNYLTSKELPAEMSDEDYVDLMVWHRGLAVPAARNLADARVQKGRSLFREMGCASCHRPSWKTGDDEFHDTAGFFEKGDKRLPKYPYQTIWPYTDMVQHRLHMVNDIRTGWCRTTPLWGRGLSMICSGHADRLHDARARNTMEAIMWHGAAESDARASVEKFRALSKEDRDAVIKFIDAI